MSPAQASSSPDRDAASSVRFTARLPHAPGSAAVARRLVRMRLGQLVPPRTLDDVLLVVSALVTYAVLHGRGDVVVQVDVDGERVNGDVCDEGDGFMRHRRTLRLGGVGANGLRVVEQITSTCAAYDDASAPAWFGIPDARQRRARA